MKKKYIQPEINVYRFVGEGAMLQGSDTKLNISNDETMNAADAYSNKGNNDLWNGSGCMWSDDKD